MYSCSECHRTIGRFDADNPPVCPNSHGKRVAEPTVLAIRADDNEDPRGIPVAASPSFQGD